MGAIRERRTFCMKGVHARRAAAAAVAAMALGLPRWTAAQEYEPAPPPGTVPPAEQGTPPPAEDPWAPAEEGTTPTENDVWGPVEENDTWTPTQEQPVEPAEQGMMEPMDEEAMEERATTERRRGPGAAVAAGGGVSDFSRSAARDFIDLGGGWDLRGIFGTRSIVGVEAAYVGTANQIAVPGDSATLFGNGLELSGRINLARNQGQRMGVQPYVLGGVAWKNYQISGNLATADVSDSDNAFEVPVGGGIAYWFSNGVMLDGRFAYRFSFEDDLIQPVGDDSATLDNWAATARLGVEF
jgi:hypothetical protein